MVTHLFDICCSFGWQIFRQRTQNILNEPGFRKHNQHRWTSGQWSTKITRHILDKIVLLSLLSFSRMERRCPPIFVLIPHLPLPSGRRSTCSLSRPGSDPHFSARSDRVVQQQACETDGFRCNIQWCILVRFQELPSSFTRDGYKVLKIL